MQNPFDSIETRLSNIETLLLDIRQDPKQATPTQTMECKTLFSIRELSEFIGCSTVTAQKFKNDGRIPFRQVGRKVMFDTCEVLKAMDQTKKKKPA